MEVVGKSSRKESYVEKAPEICIIFLSTKMYTESKAPQVWAKNDQEL